MAGTPPADRDASPPVESPSGAPALPEGGEGQPFAHLSRGEAAYRAILDQIREGVLKAGDRLREQDIAARFGMSRTPVREALGRLLEKRLLVTAGGRGLTVRALAPSEVIELYSMREILEGAAARLAAQHASMPELAALADLEAAFGREGADYAELARLNRDFHDAIHRAARNAYLDEATRVLDDNIALLGISTFSAAGRPEAARAEHQAIVEAITARDADRAEQAARAHMRAALRTRLSIVPSQRA